jgi:hypothetical protein
VSLETVVLEALPDVAEDAERRARGVTVADWLEAPPPPATRGDCEDEPRPCPALRCKYHLGRYGEDNGAACVLDVADWPADAAAELEERGARQTFVTVGRLLNVTYQRVQQARDSAFAKLRAERLEVLRSLGVRRR